MPIREFDIFRSSMHALQKKTIKILQNEGLMIDGFWFIKIYMIPLKYTDHAVNGLNMNPLFKLIELAKKNNIQLLWIWDGLKAKKSIIEGSFKVDYFEKVMKDHNIKNYRSVDKFYNKIINQEEYVNIVNDFLKRNNVIFVRAPYYAMAQAVYFQRNINSYFFGSTDFLMFEESEKVITDIDFTNSMVKIIYKNEILEAHRFDNQHFQSICLILGSEFCSTMPFYAKDFKAFDILRSIGAKDSIFNFVLSANYDEKEFYINQFVCAINLLKYCPVMTTDGVRLLSNGALKCDFELIFGRKLCDFLYEKLFKSEISAEVLEGIAFGECKEKRDSFKQLKLCYYGVLNDYFDFYLKIVKPNKEYSVSKPIHISDEKSTYVKLVPTLNKIFSTDIKVIDNIEVIDQFLIMQLIKENILKKNFTKRILCFNRKTIQWDYSKIEISHEDFTFFMELKNISQLYYNIVSAIEVVGNCKSTSSFTDFKLSNVLRDTVVKEDILFLEKIKKLLKMNIEYNDSSSYIKDIDVFLLGQK